MIQRERRLLDSSSRLPPGPAPTAISLTFLLLTVLLLGVLIAPMLRSTRERAFKA
ncbi:MAG: hypothetical protein ACE147_11350 [Candidatus Methylomirabilales bacterium]